MSRTLLLDNIEGISSGADVNGRRTLVLVLVLVADNNFSSGDFTQFLALSVNGDFAAAVPEPQPYALMLTGLAGLLTFARRRKV